MSAVTRYGGIGISIFPPSLDSAFFLLASLSLSSSLAMGENGEFAKTKSYQQMRTKEHTRNAISL